MFRLAPAALFFALFAPVLVSGTAQAAGPAVVERHVANIKAGNLDGVMADYAPDAVAVTPAGMVSPSGVFAGKDVRKLFAVLTDKAHGPGNKTLQVRYDRVTPDTTIMHWSQFRGTAQQVSGYDVFVVRGGKIVFQAVALDPAPGAK